MARKSPEQLQNRRDIRRAEVLLGLARGLTGAESAGMLQHRAATECISLHAAALEVLAAGPTGEPAFTRPQPTGRHLSVVPVPPSARPESPDDERWPRC